MSFFGKLFNKKSSNPALPEGLDHSFFEAAERSLDFTPDASKLDQRLSWLVFIYNECQRGQRSHHILGEPSVKLCAARTAQKNFVMWKKNLGHETFPIVLETSLEQKFGKSTFLGEPATITGQLHLMRPYHIRTLDNYMTNTVSFERKRVLLDIPYRVKIGRRLGEPAVHKVNAFMYVGKSEYWTEQLGSPVFQQMKLFKANEGQPFELHKYYFFNEALENNSK